MKIRVEDGVQQGQAGSSSKTYLSDPTHIHLKNREIYCLFVARKNAKSSQTIISS